MGCVDWGRRETLNKREEEREGGRSTQSRRFGLPLPRGKKEGLAAEGSESGVIQRLEMRDCLK